MNQQKKSKLRIRIVVITFFFAIASPGAILVWQAFKQLKWETFHQYQTLAVELSNRMDNKLSELVANEELRSFGDYGFTVVTGDLVNNFVQRSNLSQHPLDSTIPGLLGYFQIDPENRFSTPLLPILARDSKAFGLSISEIKERTIQQKQLLSILYDNKLIEKSIVNRSNNATVSTPLKYKQHYRSMLENKEITPSTNSLIGMNERDKQIRIKVPKSIDSKQTAQSAFDDLEERASIKNDEKDFSNSAIYGNNLGRVADIQLDSSYRQSQAVPTNTSKGIPLKKTQSTPRKVKEIIRDPELTNLSASGFTGNSKPLLRLFENEIAPIDISILKSGHLLFYRKVWQQEQRYIQGIIFDQEKLISYYIDDEFLSTSLSKMSNLAIAWRGEVQHVFSGSFKQNYAPSLSSLTGTLLHRGQLSSPFDDWELLYSVNSLPIGKSGQVIGWSAIVFLSMLSIGCWLFYRILMKQMMLSLQQQDFVSSVSHELKTPLTSIRMYGEMLVQGWVSDTKKVEYYQFIFQESERLSRLIDNVLQLARLTRNEFPVNLKYHSTSQLLDTIRSTISSQIDRAGFTLVLSDNCNSNTRIFVDEDLFLQIIINLVDNALKFSNQQALKKIVIDILQTTHGNVIVSVRDYGPGIEKGQLKKIFTLFYRSENELTRETTGTGIGLSLVHQLVQTMDANIDVVNQNPGVEFRITFKAVQNHTPSLS